MMLEQSELDCFSVGGSILFLGSRLFLHSLVVLGGAPQVVERHLLLRSDKQVLPKFRQRLCSLRLLFQVSYQRGSNRNGGGFWIEGWYSNSHFLRRSCRSDKLGNAVQDLIEIEIHNSSRFDLWLGFHYGRCYDLFNSLCVLVVWGRGGRVGQFHTSGNQFLVYNGKLTSQGFQLRGMFPFLTQRGSELFDLSCEVFDALIVLRDLTINRTDGCINAHHCSSVRLGHMSHQDLRNTIIQQDLCAAARFFDE